MNAVHLRRFDMKRIIIFISGILCICVIVFWCGRIYSVNSAYTDDTKRYGADAVVADSGLSIHGTEHKCIQKQTAWCRCGSGYMVRDGTVPGVVWTKDMGHYE